MPQDMDKADLIIRIDYLVHTKADHEEEPLDHGLIPHGICGKYGLTERASQ